MNPVKHRCTERAAARRRALRAALCVLLLAALPPGAGAQAPPAPPPAGDPLDNPRLRHDIEALEQSEGAFSPALPEVLLSHALNLEQAGRYPEAIAQLRRAVYVLRVNQGLYTPAQLPYLDRIIAAQSALGDWPGVADSYDYLLWLQRRNLAPEDPRWLPVLRRLRDWHLSAYYLPTGRPLEDHYQMQRALRRQAVELIRDATGDERLGECYWLPQCCSGARVLPRQCPARLAGVTIPPPPAGADASSIWFWLRRAE